MNYNRGIAAFYSRYVVSDETLAEALTRSRRLSLQFVRTYVDLNGNL